MRSALLLLLCSLLLALPRPGRAGCETVSPGDPLEIHLLTVAPGDALFNAFGHSALWICGGGMREQIYDWGAYDGGQDNLLGRFLAGTLEYWLSHESWTKMRRRMERQGRRVIDQQLDLPPQAARNLVSKLVYESHPSRRSYIYHWERQNCSTKLRDALDAHTGGAFQPLKEQPHPLTARGEVSRHLGAIHGADLGWDFLSSDHADLPYTRWDSLLMPQRLMEAAATAELISPDGGRRPLVKQTRTLLSGRHGFAPEQPPERRPLMAILGLLGGLGLAFAGLRGHRRSFGLGLLLLGLLSGLAGTIVLALWSVTILEVVGPTENWLLAGPQTLLLVPAGILAMLGRGRRFVAGVTAGLVAIALLGLPAQLLPGFDEHNAMWFLLLLPMLLGAAFGARPRARPEP